MAILTGRLIRPSIVSNYSVDTSRSVHYYPYSVGDIRIDDATGVASVCTSSGVWNTATWQVISRPTPTSSVLTLTSGTAVQVNANLDSMVYINVNTAAALAIAIGSDNTTAVPIVASETVALGLCTVRVPAGWYLKVTGTVADLTVTAVTC
jgi:hypothetical protein